mmetsp:Transcript_7831/g.15549  ORF Transcript_7831/g.15549 Transcript_7831/m.15549 type:complete len:465 (-) Transcript_7831:1340-2734(-)|eukprot:CAMPEP_0171493526 /NCGR_PEP_ID=MMETSP0958-20121227/5011_1 /TAXON_ID=87120 /ORGANISM="Aurantiochytrium limacinum, Strain ATCCMYA-1381" /LENGTH=464 /DNA_ID=CAMNT_0012027159 /DNA_START=849 /DNA_END=2243 /DNA_ORIENTATION=-
MFSRNFDSDDDDKKQDNLPRSQREEEDDNDDGMSNELYNLLDVDCMSSSASLAAGLSLSNLSLEGQPDMSFRNGSDLLNQTESVVYNDVYRSLSVMNEATQFNMAAVGADYLDRPNEVQSFLPPTAVKEPEPRAFGRIPLMHSHLFVHKSWPALQDMVSTHLKIKEVDAEYTESVCEWRGVVYPRAPNQAMQFVIHANACPDIGASRYLLEFVRLNGCAVAFYELFTEIQRYLMDSGIVTRSDGDSLSQQSALNPMAATMGRPAGPAFTLTRSSSISSSPLALDAFDDEDDEEDLDPIEVKDEDLYRPIVEMSRVPFVDVHVQGLALVASEAQKDAARFAKAAPSIVELLVERLSSSSHAEVQRLCCAALAAFASAKDCVKDFLTARAPEALARVAAVDFSVKGAEAQRQAVAALAALAAHVEAQEPILLAVAGYEQAFNQLEKCNDRRLVSCIGQVRQALSLA